MKSHQFAHAVYKGNTNAARSFYEPGYANIKFSITEAPGKYSLPIQYAILQKNKPMAKFLVDNGSPKKLGGKNLAYYCAYEGKSEMANYFASIGEGSSADIRRAKRDLADERKRSQQASAFGALIGLGLLSAFLSSGSSNSSNSQMGWPGEFGLEYGSPSDPWH